MDNTTKILDKYPLTASLLAYWTIADEVVACLVEWDSDRVDIPSIFD